MADRYAVGSGLWSNTTSVWSDTDGGSAGNFVPVDGDTVYISSGVSVQVDVDQSSWTGLLGMTVRGGSTPGMVYWKDGTSGTLKFRTGANVQGTNDTSNGRILANSDGSWSTDTNLSYSTTACIMLEGTAQLDCSNLDVKMICANPTHKRVRTYGTKYNFDGATDVDPSNDTIDLGTTPPSAGTMVMVSTDSGTLPEGLEEDTMYYVRFVSGNTCKLATQNNDDTIVDITADGSGTCYLYTGYSSGSATVNVLDDVTGDLWSTGDHVVLANVGPQNYDQQRTTLSAINAGTITLGDSVDSNQNPGSSIWLMTRNCRILHSATSSSQYIINGGSDCIFGEIRATSGSGTTFYCYGIYSGSGHTITTISGCDRSIYGGSLSAASLISGCRLGIYSGASHTITTVCGCNYAVYYGASHTITTVCGCNYAVYYGASHTITTVCGCNYAAYRTAGHTITTIKNCYNGIANLCSAIFVKNLIGNSYDLRGCHKVYARNGDVSSSPSLYRLNSDGYNEILFSYHHNGVLDAMRIFQDFGNSTKVDFDGTSTYPSQRTGGSSTGIELGNLQSNLSSKNKVIAWDDEDVKIWATAGTSKTYRFYVQSTFALGSSDLVLTAEYLSNTSSTATSKTNSSNSITARSSQSDWSQYLEVTVNPARDGWVYFTINLYKYSSGGLVYIDPQVDIS